MVKQDSQPVVLTVGHSTRSLEEFIDLLKAHSVASLIDVRTAPRSHHNPQFNRDTFPAALEIAGIHYTHIAGLGGFRRAGPEPLNRGWQNASFRGYADYMQTAEFAQNLTSLLKLARKQRVALMCAEAVPWRCHRSLIADALVVRGIPVEEIISGTRRQVHALTPFARVGTPFAVTLEGDAHLEFKRVLAEARPEDIVTFMSVAGLPARAVLTPWLKNYLRREKTLQSRAKADPRRCVSGLNCLSVCGLRDGIAGAGQFCIDTRLAYALKGDVKKGLFFRGSENLPFGTAIRPVADLLDYLMAGNMSAYR